jgi:molybdenum cofactor cytidylyltransferase
LHLFGRIKKGKSHMVDAVILAAGYSSRAKGFKMEFIIEGKAVISYVIEAFLPICENILVVGGYESERLIPLITPYGDKVKLIINESYDKGMFSSVKTGVKHVVAEQFFITPGDYPFITTNICKFLLDVQKSFVVPSYNHKGGHPILLASSCIEELLVQSEESNLKEFLKGLPIEYVNVMDDGIMYDLDTQEDYVMLQQRMKENLDRRE